MFLACSSYVLQLMGSVRFLSGIISTSQQAQAGATRIVELLSERSLVQEQRDVVELDEPSGMIELEHVDFAYAGASGSCATSACGSSRGSGSRSPACLVPAIRRWR